MALVPGTVAVGPDGTAVGAGLAKDLYDDEVAAYGSSFASASDGQSVRAKQTIAAKCGAWADRIDAYVKSATVTVTCPPGGGVVVGVIT